MKDIHPTAPANAEGKTAKGYGGKETALSEYVAGIGWYFLPQSPRTRRILVPGLIHATAAARHSLGRGGEMNG